VNAKINFRTDVIKTKLLIQLVSDFTTVNYLLSKCVPFFPKYKFKGIINHSPTRDQYLI